MRPCNQPRLNSRRPTLLSIEAPDSPNMALYDNTIAAYDYRSWDHDRSFRSMSIDRHAPMTSATLPSMQRFLQEPDRQWFTTNHIDIDAPMPSFPHFETEPLDCLQSIPHVYGASQRIPSPSHSGPPSYISSSWSDRQSTPISSPDTSVVARSPQMAYAGQFDYSYGDHRVLEDTKPTVNGMCVALNQIQTYEDTQPEQGTLDDEQAYCYASFQQEGYQPMESDVEPSVNGNVNGIDPDYGERSCPESPNLRHRRHGTRSNSSPRHRSKIGKRPTEKKRSPSYQAKTATTKSNACCQSNSNRSFPCPFAIYGCLSVFGSKNEWKRHVNTQHMRTGYWRCDQCDQSERKPNDFNRKDLFIQHVRRMHPQTNGKTAKPRTNGPRSAKNDPEEQEMAEVAHRCFRRIRCPPEKSGCLFCDAKFNGPSTWDERLEHIGKHMEATKKDNEEPVDPKDWQEDSALHDWLAREGIIARAGKGWALAEGRA